MRKLTFRMCSNCEADQHHCFHYTDSTILLLSKPKISSFKPSSVLVRLCLCQTWSETPEDRLTRIATPIYIFLQKPAPAAPSAELHPELMDLSFSTSFGGDDFMSAVDKLERDYGNNETNRPLNGNVTENDSHKKLVTNSVITKQTCVSSVRSSKHVNKHEIASKPPVLDKASANLDIDDSSNKSKQEVPLIATISNRTNVKVKQNQANNQKAKVIVDKTNSNLKSEIGNKHNAKSGTETGLKVRACQLRTESKENVESTPKSEIDRRKSRLSITSSFLMSPDISFTSPQCISTPQVTPENNKSKQTTNLFSKPGISAIVKAKNETKKHKGKLAGKKKDMLEVTPARTKDVTKSNKSDFFKSLFMDKSSDISVSPDVTNKILVDKTPELVESVTIGKAQADETSAKAENKIQDVQLIPKKSDISSNMKWSSSKETAENSRESKEKKVILSEDSRSNIKESRVNLDCAEDKNAELEVDKDLKEKDNNTENAEGDMPHGTAAEKEIVLHSNIGIMFELK